MILGYGPDWSSANTGWQKYFVESLGLSGEEEIVEFKNRPFGDGGYLDNKPFTYVTETLSRRYSNVPVRRKLLYVEPSPEHPDADPENLARPDAVENVMAALLNLPRQKTIREDLQRLLERNRLIERADRTLNQVREDIAKNEPIKAEPKDWTTKYLPELIRDHGISYVPYRRMRIADTTDELSTCLTSSAGFDWRSDEFLAVRAIVHTWRDANYADYESEKNPALTLRSMNAFLDQSDLGFRVRRMTFIRRQIDVLHRMSDSREEDLEKEGTAAEIRAAYRNLRRQATTTALP